MFDRYRWRLLFGMILLASCSKEMMKVGESPDEKELTAYQSRVVEYFQEVALGFEFGNSSRIVRKWSDSLYLYVGGTTLPELEMELYSIINEINALTSDGFGVAVTTDSISANYYLFLGSGAAYAELYPQQAELTKSNWGLFYLNWNGMQQLTSGHMYVDIFRADLAAQKHLLREELTQSLGLARDSKRYPDSIFQLDWTLTSSYTDIDRDIIRLLYHPEVHSGMTKKEVKTTLEAILAQE